MWKVKSTKLGPCRKNGCKHSCRKEKVLCMDKYTLLGIEEGDFPGKNGETVYGSWLHIGTEKTKCKGLFVERVYASSRVFNADKLNVGDEIIVYYTRNGKVASVIKA